MAELRTLAEAFDTLDTTTRWTVSGDVSVSGSELLIRPDAVDYTNSIKSKVRWGLDGSAPYSVIEFVPAAGREGLACLGFVNTGNQGLLIEQKSATEYRVITDAGSGSLYDSTTLVTTDRYWRVILTGDTAAVSSSANGTTWTARKSQNMSSGNTGFSWKNAGVAEFFIRLRIFGTEGTEGPSPVPAFRGINEPTLTTVTAVKAAATSLAPIPVVQQWTTVNLTGPSTAAVAAPEPSLTVGLDVSPATASAAAVEPSLTIYVDAPVAAASVEAPAPALVITLDVPTAVADIAAVEPTLDLPIPVAMSPPVAEAVVITVAPNVIAPFPHQVLASTATAESSAFAPNVQQIENTTVESPVMGAAVHLFPPGEYVRISSPPASAMALLLPTLRVGPVFSRFAATVAQTEQNFGGASIYYRLDDETTTLTDVLGDHHGGWSGAQVLVPGGVTDDPDLAMEFNGTDTVAYNGLMPDYQPFFDSGWGDHTNATSEWRKDEYPRVWGWSAMVVFRTLPGATRTNIIYSRDSGTGAFDQMLTVNTEGRLVARSHHLNDLVEIMAGPAVNDGEWHQAIVTKGNPLDDPIYQGPIRLYLDGVLQGFVNFPPSLPTRPLTIGGTNGNAIYEGALDEYAEWDYAISRWEVKELWNQLKNLTGPPLRLEVMAPATAALTTVVPAIRKSPVRPLNEFFDDFTAPFIDRSKWRDASAGARVIAGSAVLRANGEKLLTQDYFQVRDSSFIIRVDKLPIKEGITFLGLVNEYDIIPDEVFGGIFKWDSLRRHRTIGFNIDRSTIAGRTRTTLGFTAYGQSFFGPQIRSASIPYIVDDPNYPSPHRWLRLDIDPGRNGGATWYTSPNGVTWTEQYDIHGGKANAVTTKKAVSGDDGSVAVVTETTISYEETGSFYIFDRDVMHEEATTWLGHMRVAVIAEGGSVVAELRIDNVNTPPTGTGTPAEIIAKSARIQTSSSNEYLMYVLVPRIYSSGQDVSVEVPVITASVRAPAPPEPVYVFTPPLTAQTTMHAPERAGDALPVAISAVPATTSVAAVPPTRAGDAQPVFIEPNQAQAYGIVHPPVEVNTDQSSPAPVGGRTKRVITLKTRNVRVLVTQN